MTENYTELDNLCAPNSYTVFSNDEENAYAVHFLKTCRRYNIDISQADNDEREFVVHMAEKSFYAQQA